MTVTYGRACPPAAAIAAAGRRWSARARCSSVSDAGWLPGSLVLVERETGPPRRAKPFRSGRGSPGGRRRRRWLALRETAVYLGVGLLTWSTHLTPKSWSSAAFEPGEHLLAAGGARGAACVGAGLAGERDARALGGPVWL